MLCDPTTAGVMQTAPVVTAIAANGAMQSATGAAGGIGTANSVFAKHIPGVAGCAAEVTVGAGEALYIPTGWFHQVRSVALPTAAEEGDFSGRGPHAAINFWFVPDASA
jgi:hypothetical protein